MAPLATVKRGLSREEAAYIVGVSSSLFDRMVEGMARRPSHAATEGVSFGIASRLTRLSIACSMSLRRPSAPLLRFGYDTRFRNVAKVRPAQVRHAGQAQERQS